MKLGGSFLIGLLLSAAIASTALLSFIWVPYDVTVLSIGEKLQGASRAHWFGTDHFGRDLLSMIMVGARTSLAVALVAVGIALGLACPSGWQPAQGKVAGWTRSSCGAMI